MSTGMVFREHAKIEGFWPPRSWHAHETPCLSTKYSMMITKHHACRQNVAMQEQRGHQTLCLSTKYSMARMRGGLEPSARSRSRQRSRSFFVCIDMISTTVCMYVLTCCLVALIIRCSEGRWHCTGRDFALYGSWFRACGAWAFLEVVPSL